MSRRIAVLVFLVLVLLALTGCDDGPKCLRSHSETHVGTSLVFNGKTTMPVTSVTTVTVCDEYEKPVG